jgi:hypothetical protein
VMFGTKWPSIIWRGNISSWPGASRACALHRREASQTHCPSRPSMLFREQQSLLKVSREQLLQGAP